MNTNDYPPLLRLALVPLTAAILGGMILALFYFIQPTKSQHTSKIHFQDQVGLVHLEAHQAAEPATYHIL